jgi:hypothetical protein
MMCELPKVQTLGRRSFSGLDKCSIDTVLWPLSRVLLSRSHMESSHFWEDVLFIILLSATKTLDITYKMNVRLRQMERLARDFRIQGMLCW